MRNEPIKEQRKKQSDNRYTSLKGSDGGSASIQFKDNRPEAIRMKRIQDSIVKEPVLPAQLRKMGASIEGVVQLASSIEYDTTEFDLENGEKEIVGKKMDAHLEQGDPINGSAPGDGVQSGLMKELKSVGYNRMIRGHLLNGQFGGLGVAMNLFPITAKANSMHKNHVENPIKSHIKKGKDIDYTVEVINAANTVSDPDAAFKCTATDASDGTSLVDEVVSSVPSKTATSSKSKTAEGSILNNSKSVSFPTRNMKTGWGEVGKGFSSSNTAHKKTAKRISSISLDGEEQDINSLSSGFVGGRSFVNGSVDRREYASELTQYYIDEYGHNKLYFKFNPSKGYMPDDLEELIANSFNEDVELIIERLENLLDDV